MDEILIKYVIGEATLAEEEMVAGWLKESSANEKHLAHIRLIWETSKTLQTESDLDEESSWQEFIQLRDRPVQRLERPEKNTHWLRIAALWVVISGTALLLFTRYYQAKPEMLTLQSYDTVKTDTLSDGSVITLNKNSVIEYPAKFTGNTREMKLLSGEAFFSIAHNRQKPFIVHINDAAVRVVGTSFNIRNDHLKAQVIVETGIVEVTRKKVIIRLVPSEKVEIDYRSGEFKKGMSKDNFYNYYRTKEFMANKTPLWRVAEVLNDVYKVNIQIPDQALANRQITTTFRLGSLDQILEIISFAFKVQVIHESNTIIIR